MPCGGERLAKNTKPIFPRWLSPGSRLPHQRLSLTPKVPLQKFSPKNRCRHPFRRCLEPPHTALLPCSSAELDPSSAPGTHNDDTQTVLFITASLTPRHTPAAAGRSVPQSPRRMGGRDPEGRRSRPSQSASVIFPWLLSHPCACHWPGGLPFRFDTGPAGDAAGGETIPRAVHGYHSGAPC